MGFNADDYLAHHGIKGQRWGIRRYQNEDGSLTGAGRARYGTDGSGPTRRLPTVNIKRDSVRSHKASVKQAQKIIAKENRDSGMFDQTVKGGKDKPNISPAEYITKQVGNAIDSTKTGLEAAHRLKESSKPKTTYDDISDAELRRRINRIRMEREYESLSKTDDSKGYRTTMDVLSVVGSIAGAATAVLGVYSTIKGLKG